MSKAINPNVSALGDWAIPAKEEGGSLSDAGLPGSAKREQLAARLKPSQPKIVRPALRAVETQGRLGFLFTW